MGVLELIAVTFTFLCVILSTRENIWCWPTGMIGVIAFFLVFLEQKLYAETTIQVVFLLQSIYGWYNWVRGNDSKELPVTSKSIHMFGFDILNTLIVAIILGGILDNYTDTPQPYLDATTACLSLLANWYLVKKYIQTWILWCTVDVLLIIMFLNQNLNVSAILYIALFGFSSYGLILWKRSIKTA